MTNKINLSKADTNLCAWRQWRQIRVPNERIQQPLSSALPSPVLDRPGKHEIRWSSSRYFREKQRKRACYLDKLQTLRLHTRGYPCAEGEKNTSASHTTKKHKTVFRDRKRQARNILVHPSNIPGEYKKKAFELSSSAIRKTLR